jgi:hypothetical protein
LSTKYSATPALVAQRIEHRPPEPCAQVRVLPRAQLESAPDQRKEADEKGPATDRAYPWVTAKDRSLGEERGRNQRNERAAGLESATNRLASLRSHDATRDPREGMTHAWSPSGLPERWTHVISLARPLHDGMGVHG